MDKLRIAQYGLGTIGLGIVETILSRPWAELVGAIDSDKTKVGKDVGELLGSSKRIGIKVAANADEVLDATSPTIVTHATSSNLQAILGQLTQILKHDVSVISSAEELSYPFAKHPALASSLDELAKRRQKVILGTGVNPGFVLDTVPVMLSGACKLVNSIRAERVVDASRRRFQLQHKIGAGLSAAEFEKKISDGTIKHVGLSESVGLISLAMGWKLGEIQERISPVIAERETTSGYVSVPAGHVAGIRQVAKGILAGQELVVLDLRIYLGAQNPHDSILIDGVPPIDLIIRGGVDGDSATPAILVNSIPRILNLHPGLRTMIDLPPISSRLNLPEEADRSVMLRTI